MIEIIKCWKASNLFNIKGKNYGDLWKKVKNSS